MISKATGIPELAAGTVHRVINGQLRQRWGGQVRVWPSLPPDQRRALIEIFHRWAMELDKEHLFNKNEFLVAAALPMERGQAHSDVNVPNARTGMEHGALLADSFNFPPPIAPALRTSQTPTRLDILFPALVPAPGNGLESYRYWMREGDRLASLGELDRACDAYLNAVRQTGTRTPDRADVYIQIAKTFCGRNSLGQAKIFANNALNELGLPDELRPSNEPSRERIEAEFKGTPSGAITLPIYGRLARTYSSIYRDEEHFDLALASLTTMAHIGDVLSDDHLRAESLNFQGQIHLEQGAVADPDGINWRTATDLHLIAQAEQDFRAAHRLRPRDTQFDAILAAGDLRLLIRALRLLGREDETRDLIGQVGDLYGDNSAIVGWLKDQAGWFMYTGRESSDERLLKRAHDLFLQTSYAAVHIKSASFLSHTLAALGCLYEPVNHDIALDYYGATLFAWPFSLNSKDFYQYVMLFQRVWKYLTPVVYLNFEFIYETMKDKTGHPYDITIPLVTFNPSRAKELTSYVKRRSLAS